MEGYDIYPGITARPVSGKPNTAFSPEMFRILTTMRHLSQETLIRKMIRYENRIPQIRRSQDKAISSPPPSATPSIAAIVGILNA